MVDFVELVDLRALGTEERWRRGRECVCAKKRTKLVRRGTCTQGLDVCEMVDSGARKGMLWLCVFFVGKERQAASSLSAVSFLVCANPGVQLVAEYFAKFGKAGSTA